jgi:hypothetical protein
MHHDVAFSIACFSAMAIGGISLIAAAFLPKYRGASRWFRIALILSGVFALAWSALGFTLLFCASDISRYARVVLDRSRIFVGGIVFDSCLAFFAVPSSGILHVAFTIPHVANKQVAHQGLISQ